MTLEISAAFPPGLDTPDHVALAEELGYRRAWLYDSPALYHDVWMTLARAAERTEQIGLGPAVLVPSLRHPMTNAAAVATLADLAPGRVAVAIGAGFTGRHVLGHRAMRWSDVRAYALVLRALLRGEEVEWEGRPIRMIHPPGFGPARPIEVPVLVAADGPKGTAVADEVGDGTFAAGLPNTSGTSAWRALLQFGTVLDDGEGPSTPRVIEAAGPGAAVAVHGFYERGGATAVDNLPGGREWRAQIEALDERTRHLAVHDGHLVRLSDNDRAAMAAGLNELIPAVGLTGSPSSVREKLAGFEALGVSELAYQPAAHDVPRDLRTFAAATGLADPDVNVGATT